MAKKIDLAFNNQHHYVFGSCAGGISGRTNKLSVNIVIFNTHAWVCAQIEI
jgi:hypothetical protein